MFGYGGVGVSDGDVTHTTIQIWVLLLYANVADRGYQNEIEDNLEEIINTPEYREDYFLFVYLYIFFFSTLYSRLWNDNCKCGKLMVFSVADVLQCLNDNIKATSNWTWR